MDAFLSAAAAYAGGEPSETLRQLTRGFLLRARDDASAVEEATAALALPTLSPHGAAWVGVVLGAVIEDRGGAQRSAPAIIDLLRSWLAQLPSAPGGSSEVPRPTPRQAQLLDALKQLAPSVVAHLARTPDLRAKLSQDLALLDRLEALEAYTAGAAWIREMLLRSSGSLILLHVPSGKGLRLRYENVATCFHLFSLIQATVGERIPGGRAPSPLVAAAARGKAREAVQDEAWWHYGDPRSKVPELRSAIWGEALVREIPVVAGERVVLLWPAIQASRSWDSAFFGPQLDALRPDVVIESELSPAECATWFQTLGIRQARRRWWWPW